MYEKWPKGIIKSAVIGSKEIEVVAYRGMWDDYTANDTLLDGVDGDPECEYYTDGKVCPFCGSKRIISKIITYDSHKAVAYFFQCESMLVSTSHYIIIYSMSSMCTENTIKDDVI